MISDHFFDQWSAFVARWTKAEQAEVGSGTALLDEVLQYGLPHETGGLEHSATDDELLLCEIEVIRRSGAVDAAAYLGTVPPLKLRDGDAVRHFCRRGWRALRNPSHEFDVWWYTSEYLDSDVDSVNPLLHFVLVGRFAGYSGLPDVLSAHTPTMLTSAPDVRRVCLFAGADIDGIVDPHVVRYVRELSRFADVYYLSGSPMLQSELDKLADVTVGAWAMGLDTTETATSATLAGELVGWDTIDQYDELLLVNDSHYLLRPLDELFSTMDQRACDWWTLRVSSTRFVGKGADRASIPFDEVRRKYLPRTVIRRDETVRFDSSFLAFRRSVIADEGFRRLLAQMVPRDARPVRKGRHEIGLTRFLAARGYDLSAFDNALRPNDQPYGPTGFELSESGYPLLSRVYLSTNPDDIPDFGKWRSRLGSVTSEEVLGEIETHLARVSSDAELQRSFSVVTRPDGTVDRHEAMTALEFEVADRTAPKYEHWWAFPVCAYDHTFAGNERAVFEEVRDDPSIKKIVLTRSRRIVVAGENVVIVPIESPEGQFYLTRSRFVFVKHTLSGNVPWPVSPMTHDAINLWHGIPLKRFGMASAGLDDETREMLMSKQGASRAVVTSSRMDTLAMSAAFFPVSYPDMWPTGLPRNDFIMRDEDKLPADLRATLDRLRDELAGRRLVMFLPTFRDGQGDSQYQFDEAELTWLSEWAERHHAVLGVREHMADKARTYSAALAPLGAIDLSSRRYPDLEILYRVADALVSDYSSCLVDFMMTGKPMMSFAYDYDRYSNDERGLFYELDRVLPGPVCRSFGELATALDTAFDPRTDEQVEEYDWKRRIFFDHLDDQASWRVVKRVKGLYLDND